MGILASTLLVAAGCGSGSSQQGSSEPIRVGVVGPFTGPYASAGLDELSAANVVAKTINSAGGSFNGRKIEIVSADDQCDAQVGVQAAQKLVTEKVVAFVGGYCSGASIPETDILRRSGDIPFVAVASSNPKLTEQGYDNVFRATSRDDDLGPIDASFITQILNGRRVALMHDNTVFAKGLAGYVRDALVKSGATITYFDAITPGEKDYTSALTRVASTNPDVFEYTGYYAEAAILIKQYKQLGLNNKFSFMAGSTVFDPALLQAAGQDANGMYVNYYATLGQGLTGPKVDAFVKTYKQQTGKDAGPYSVSEADGMNVLAQALMSAKSTNPADLIKALRAVKYDGLQGTFSFDAKGDLQAPFPMINYIVQNAAFVPYARQNGSTWVKV